MTHFRAPLLAIALSTLALTAHAGGVTLRADSVDLPSTPDWNGFYAGVQTGAGNLRLDYPGGRQDVDLTANGVFAGYQQALQDRVVIGAELDYNSIQNDNYGTADLIRLRARAGADFGRFLTYVTLGAAHWDGGEVSKTGVVYGVGVDYQVNDRFVLGAEYTRHNFNDAVPSVPNTDLALDLFQLRGSFRF